MSDISLGGLLLLALIGVFVKVAFTQTGKGRLNFKNPRNGRFREAPVGFSWTTLFLGPFPALFRGHYVGALIILLVTAVTLGIAGLVFPFFYNKWYVNYLIKNGYKVSSADGDINVISKYLSRELPLIEATTAV